MARKTPLDPEKALAGPLYALAIALAVMPAIDFIQNIGDLQPGNVQWRFATIGLLSTFVVTPLIGIAMAMIVAAIRGHAVVLRVLAIMNLVAAAVLLALLLGFVLDVLQLRVAVPDEGKRGFESASVRAILKHTMTVVLLLAFGLRGLRIATARPTKSG